MTGQREAWVGRGEGWARARVGLGKGEGWAGRGRALGKARVGRGGTRMRENSVRTGPQPFRFQGE